MSRSPCLRVWPGHLLQERTRQVLLSRRDRIPAAVFDRSLLSLVPVVPGQEGPSVLLPRGRSISNGTSKWWQHRVQNFCRVQ